MLDGLVEFVPVAGSTGGSRAARSALLALVAAGRSAALLIAFVAGAVVWELMSVCERCWCHGVMLSGVKRCATVMRNASSRCLELRIVFVRLGASFVALARMAKGDGGVKGVKVRYQRPDRRKRPRRTKGLETERKSDEKN